MDTSKQYALVCGARGGVGSAFVRAFSDAGFSVVCIVRPGSGKDAEVSFQDIKSPVHVYEADCADADDVLKVVGRIIELHGNCSAAVFAAVEGLVRENIVSISAADFHKAFSVSVFGAQAFFSALFPSMVQGGHFIGITTSSLEPNVISGSLGGYIPAKYALRGLLREFGEAGKKKGICVNAIAPGFMRTELQKDMPERMDDFLKEKNPFHDIMTPERVAAFGVALASGVYGPVTGQTFVLGLGDVETL